MTPSDKKYIKSFRSFLLQWLHETMGENVRIVQVGANDGTMADPLAPVINLYNWSALLIEPVPRYFSALAEKYKGNTRTILKNVAISSGEGTETIYFLSIDAESGYPGWARGLASFDRKHLERAIRPEHVASLTVPCHPLSKLLSDDGFNDAHLLVVDVEGAEQLVFSSFKWAQFRPLMIEVETRHLQRETKDWLFKHFGKGGYDVYDFGFDSIAIRRGWLPSSLRHIFGLTMLGDFKIAPTEDARALI